MVWTNPFTQPFFFFLEIPINLTHSLSINNSLEHFHSQTSPYIFMNLPIKMVKTDEETGLLLGMFELESFKSLWICYYTTIHGCRRAVLKMLRSWDYRHSQLEEQFCKGFDSEPLLWLLKKWQWASWKAHGTSPTGLHNVAPATPSLTKSKHKTFPLK